MIRRWWQGFSGRVNFPGNTTGTQAFEIVDEHLRRHFGRNSEVHERALLYNDVFARENIVAEGVASSGTYLFQSVSGVPQPIVLSNWFDCGGMILDTEFNDPIPTAADRRAVYSARVSPLRMNQVGTAGASREVSWLLRAHPVYGSAIVVPTSAGVVQIPESHRRIYLMVRCWCSEQANGVSPIDLQLTDFKWELLATS